LYYKYNVTYGTDGKVNIGITGNWLEHPSAPDNYKSPDSAWFPNKQTRVGSFWNGELNYDNIEDIIPLN